MSHNLRYQIRHHVHWEHTTLGNIENRQAAKEKWASNVAQRDRFVRDNTARWWQRVGRDGR